MENSRAQKKYSVKVMYFKVSCLEFCFKKVVSCYDRTFPFLADFINNNNKRKYQYMFSSMS